MSVVSGDAFHVSSARSSPVSTMTLEIVGGVESYFKANDPLPPWFPAASVQEPVTVAPALSGPAYVCFVHEATPDVVSAPVNETSTGWLYQPLPSGVRAAPAPVTEGGVAS